MIRFRLKELMADKGFRERRVVTLLEVANATGINRMTLSKIANRPGYSTVTDSLDRLCAYFGCELGQLAEHIPDPPAATGHNGNDENRPVSAGKTRDEDRQEPPSGVTD